ncbi:hypothetical protein [Mesorhizobium sp.]|uniref:hypothetical protein n=1 Tax=Mesorhizobium sp. TaxID=1871066 RepID=UPI001211FAC1|nr:hypothetical protein [Mesorhizobium sp.]TIL43654.1 MAG: hypothetical protein E5Y86_20820 [Mesorhizobium sp.]TIL53162.1 MAG: hypothetical protein E5Y83_09250 [Mesorhizobium sp.]TIL88937.1 MAG: hypothetical protein E5Y73_22235 [Mesorhizobium sp.]
MTLIEATATLGTRLELLKRDFDLATKNGPEDWQISMAAFQSVSVVVDFMSSLPGMGGLDFGLIRIMEAISSVEKGTTPSWLLNGSAGRPGVSDRVAVVRARYGAVMAYLMQVADAYRDRTKAAQYVWRKIPSRVQIELAGERGTWRSVAGWRDEFIGSTEATELKAGYLSTLHLLSDRMTGTPEERASKMIGMLAKQVA